MANRAAAGGTAVIQEPELIYLSVRVPEVRCLAKKLVRSQITPFLRLRLGEVEHRSTYGTGYDPKFADEFMFAISSEKIRAAREVTSGPAYLVLSIKICDYVKYGFSDELGEVTVPLMDIVDGAFAEGKWFTVPKRGAAEMIRNIVRKREDTGDPNETQMLVYADVASYTAPQNITVGQLSVTVHGATKLRHHSVVAKGAGEKFFCPYGVVTYDGSWGVLPTRVNTNNPVWLDTFTFPVSELSSVVSIALFDNRKARMRKDKLLGLVRVRLNTLIGNSVNTCESYPLYVVKDNIVRVMGHLRLSLAVEYFLSPLGVCRHLLSPPERFYRSTLSAKLIQQMQKAKMLRVQQFLSGASPPIPLEVSEVFMERDDNPKVFTRNFRQNKLRLQHGLGPMMDGFLTVRAVQRWVYPYPSMAVNILWPFLMYLRSTSCPPSSWS
jgi:hypothetical protein